MAKQNTSPVSATPASKAPGAKRAPRPAPPPARPAAAPTTQRPVARPGEPTGWQGRIAGLQRTFRETVAELRKVQWPDRMTTRNLTLVVIGMSVALSAVLGLFDALLTWVFEWLIKF